jgi:hypothetical protein
LQCSWALPQRSFTSGGAGQTEIPPPDWKAKDLGVGKIPKAPHGPMTTIWAPGD